MSKENITSYLKNDSKSNSIGNSTNSNISLSNCMKSDNILGNSHITSFFKNEKEGLKQKNIQFRNNQVKEIYYEHSEDIKENDYGMNKRNNDCIQVNETILKFFTEKEIDSFKKSYEILLKLINLNEYERKVFLSLIYNQYLLNEDEENYVRKVNFILQKLFYINDISEYVSYIKSNDIGRKIYDYNDKLLFFKSYIKKYIENYEFSRLSISDISNSILSENQKHCLSDRSLLKKAISLKAFEFIQKFTLTEPDFIFNFTNIIHDKDVFSIKTPPNPDLDPLMESLEYINEEYNEYKFINLIIQTYSLSIMTYPELIDIIRKALIEYTEITFEIIKEDETEKEKYYNLSKKLELKHSQNNKNSKIDLNYENIIIKNEEEISNFIKSLNFSIKLEQLIDILENKEKSNEEKQFLSEKIILYSNNNSTYKYNGRISFNINEEKLNFIIKSMIKSVNGNVNLSDNDDIEMNSENENENNLDWELLRVLSVKDSINQIIQNIKEDYLKGIIYLSENIIVNECFKRFNSIVNTLSCINNQNFKCYLGIIIDPSSNDIRIICINKEKLDEVLNNNNFCIEKLVDIINNKEIEFIHEEYLIFNYLYEKDMLDTQTLEIKKGYIETVKKIKYFIEKYNPDIVYIIGKPYKTSKLYERIVNIYKKEVYYIDYSLVEVFINSLLSRIEIVSQVGQSKLKNDYLSKLSLIIINYYKKVLIMTYIPNFIKNPLRNYEFSYLQSYLSEESKNILFKKIEFVIYLYKQYEENDKTRKFDLSIIDNSNDSFDNTSIIKIVNSQNFNTICFELECAFEGVLLNHLQLIGISNDLFFYSNIENSFVVKGNSKKQANLCLNEGFYIGRIKKINKLKGNIEISQSIDDILNHNMFFNTVRENLNTNTNQISKRNHSYISILNNSIFLYENYIINQPKPELKLQKRLISSWLKKYYIDKTFCQLSKEASLIQFGEVFFRPSPLGNSYITLSIVLKNCMIMNVHIKESIKLEYLQEVGKGLLTYSSDKIYNCIEDFYEIYVYKTVDYLKKVVSNQNFSFFNDIISVQRELINCQVDDNKICFKFYILIPGYVTLGLCIPNSRIWFVHFLINENGFNLINILKIHEYAENIFNFYCGNQYESINNYVIKVFDSLDLIISFLKSDENSLIFKNAYECTAYTSLLYCPYHIYIDESNFNEIEVITENIVPIRKEESNKKKGMNPPPSKEIYKNEYNQSSLVQHDEKELQSFKSGRSYLTKYIPTDNIFSEMEKMGNEYEEFSRNHKRNDDVNKNNIKTDNEGWGWDENKSVKENTSVKNYQFSNIVKSNLICNYCKEEGHIIKECVKLQIKKKKENNNNERKSNDDNSRKDFTGFKREQSSNFNNRNDTWGNDCDNKGNNKSDIKVEASINNRKIDNDDDWGDTQIVYKKEENNEIKEDDNDSWGKPTVSIKQNTNVNKEDNNDNDNWGGGSSFQNQSRNFNNKDNNRRDNFNNRDNNFKPKPNNKCFNCNEEGHRANECTKPRQERPKKSFACFNCNKEGHRISDCPEPRQERKRNFNNDNSNTYNNNSNRYNRDNSDNRQPRGGYNKPTSGNNNNDISNKGWEWDENDNSNKNTNFNEINETDKGKSNGNDDWDTVFTNLNTNTGEKKNNSTKEDGEW